MENEYWINRWKTHQIGWHQTEVESALINWASHLKPTRVLVPLCGKSLDLVWLHNQGFEVVGAELSTEACEEFFAENKLSFEKTIHGMFTIYSSVGITIFNGDFFHSPQNCWNLLVQFMIERL